MFIDSCFVHCQTWMSVTWHSPRINNRVRFFMDSFISSDTKSASTALPCIILTNWMSPDLLTCQFVFFGFIFFKMACSCVEGQHAILITTYVRESLVNVVLAVTVSDFCSSAEICFFEFYLASLYVIKLCVCFNACETDNCRVCW